MIRLDLIFTYWIFVWYLFYIFKYVKLNPKFILIIGVLENLLLVLLMIRVGLEMRYILTFLLGNSILKFIPLYTIWDTKIKSDDIVATMLLLLAYEMWLRFNRTNIIEQYIEITESILEKKFDTPFMYFVHKIEIKNIL
jgi:hypothetical protein